MMAGCDWVEAKMYLRVPDGTPEPTKEQWDAAAKALGAEGFTRSSGSCWYKVYNHDMRLRREQVQGG